MRTRSAFGVSPSSLCNPIQNSRNGSGYYVLKQRPMHLEVGNGHSFLSYPSSLAHSTSLGANMNSILLSDVSPEPLGVYEAVMPPTTTLIGYGLIIALCALGGWVWANQVVPTSRAKLALSKNRGEVKEYLDDLRASDSAMNTQVDAQEDTDIPTDTDVEETESSASSSQGRDARKFERWLFTDWLQDNKSARKNGRQKVPALPILKEAKWNSGDNPVLVASALIGLGVLITAITERVVSLV